MIQLYRFNDFPINEAMGIATASIFYVDLLTARCLSDILDYVEDTNEITALTDKKLPLDKTIKEITFSYRDLKRYVTNWNQFADFPIFEIKLELSLNQIKMGDYIDLKGKPAPFALGGYMSLFAKGNEKNATRISANGGYVKQTTDHKISLHMGISFYYAPNFNKNIHEKKLQAKLESIILHELLHAYENYKKKLSGAKRMEIALTWASIGENKRRRPIAVWKYWQLNFTDYIYMSEPHEMGAYVQEAKAYVYRLDFNKFKETSLWKKANELKNFSSKNFIINIEKIITNVNLNNKDVLLNSLVEEFKQDYINGAIDLKENPKINPHFINKMTKEEFFDFWEKVIRKAGNTLVRKLMRLYAHKKDREDDYL